MLNWNVQLKLGLAGFASAILIALWLVRKEILNEGLPQSGLIAMNLLLFASIVTMIGSQITVERRTSLAEDDDDDDDDDTQDDEMR